MNVPGMLLLCLGLFAGFCINSYAQVSKSPPLKLSHAEPLYIDLIRDLGAHKGEREWNVGAAFVDHDDYNSYEFLVEYEWAVRDRWGLEVELPVSIYSQSYTKKSDPVNAREPQTPANRIESLKLATQYTFLVSEAWQTSLAAGSIVEFELNDLNLLRRENIFRGILYNPFLIAAKRLGNHWHSLLYTGPRLHQHFGRPGLDFSYEANFNLHYMLPGTRNFFGLELNTLLHDERPDLVIRPQMRLALTDRVLLGIVPGIPLHWENERLSLFARLIYEPGH